MLAFFDCFSGISGDMALGAFIDLGVPVDKLRQDLDRLPIEPFSIQVSHTEQHGIRAVRCQVVAESRSPTRHLSDIEAIIGGSHLSDTVKRTALSIFRKMATAEAGVHGCAMEEVHFHEVGAVDAIVDIVGCALCLEYLGIDRVAASPLPQGHGMIDCCHGRLPLPAPATLSLLKGIPVYGIDLEGELVTPTGAAIIASLAKEFGPMPPMTMAAVGYGAGRRTFATHPNLLRIAIGEDCGDGCNRGFLSDTVYTMETSIDDMNPEVFGYLMEALFAGGALDVYWIPVYMKKNRPGTLIQVLCHQNRFEALRGILFKETTTIGVRVSTASRWLLPRETVTLSLTLGSVALKRIRMPDGEIRWAPEYEDCRRVAKEKGIPIRRAYEQIAAEAAALELRRSPLPTDH